MKIWSHPLTFCSKSACPRLTSGHALSGRWLRSMRTAMKLKNWPMSNGTNSKADSCSLCSPAHDMKAFPPFYTINWPEEICRAGRDLKKQFWMRFWVFVGIVNVRRSSISTQAIVVWFELQLTKEHMDVIFSVDVAVRSKPHVWKTLLFSWGLKQLTSFLNMQTFVFAPFITIWVFLRLLFSTCSIEHTSVKDQQSENEKSWYHWDIL